MKLVAAFPCGLALAVGVLSGSPATTDSRIERVSSAVTDAFDRDPQNAGSTPQVSRSGTERRSAWFNVHVRTGALHRSSDRDPRDAGPVRQAPSPGGGATYRSTWFNVH